MGAINTPSYFQTCKVMATDLLYIPFAVAESSDVVDKVCKFVIGLEFCPVDIAKEFKTTTGLISTLGFTNTVAGFSNTISGARGGYHTTAKKISKVILLGAQGFDLFKGLDQLKILSLATVSQFLGRYSFTAFVLNAAPGIGTVKDALILASTGFSIYDSYNESVNLAASVNMPALAYAKAVHKNRIAVIADVAKFAIVGLTLSVTAATTLTTTMPISGTVLAISYSVIKIGQYASNSLGMISASAALIKSTHGAAAA